VVSTAGGGVSHPSVDQRPAAEGVPSLDGQVLIYWARTASTRNPAGWPFVRARRDLRRPASLSHGRRGRSGSRETASTARGAGCCCWDALLHRFTWAERVGLHFPVSKEIVFRLRDSTSSAARDFSVTRQSSHDNSSFPAWCRPQCVPVPASMRFA